MSFALTERQLMDGSKTVTRRLGWKDLPAGAMLIAVRKAMGLRRGEKQTQLCRIHVVSVTPEPLNAITAAECAREGFPELTPTEFIWMFQQAHGGPWRCPPDVSVQRIEFEMRPL